MGACVRVCVCGGGLKSHVDCQSVCVGGGGGGGGGRGG